MKIHANSCLHNSAGENKMIRVRELRATRDTREATELPDMRASAWDDLGPHDRVVFSDMDLWDHEGSRQWLHNIHKGELVRKNQLMIYNNVGFSARHRQTKWGCRGYNIPKLLVRDCDFTEITQEHGLYMSNSSSVTVERSTFVRTGSQGLQFAHRPNPYQQYDADCMPYDTAPLHTFEDCHFVDCGKGGTRPSFNLTMFDPGCSEYPATIRITDSSFVSNWSTAGPKNNFSTGAFVFTPSQGGPDNDERNPIGAFAIKNCLFDFAAGDRPIGKIDGATTIHITDSCFIARAHTQPFIDINRKQPWKSSVLLKNCTSKGDVKLRIWDGDDVIARVGVDTGLGRSIYIEEDGSVFTR